MFSVGDTAWQVDPRTGDHWPVASDAESSEREVEGTVGTVPGTVEAMEGIVGAVEGNALTAARELIRVEVR